MRRAMTSIFGLAFLVLFYTAGAADVDVANLDAKVTKTMASIFKHAKPASSDKRRSLAMTSASSTYTAPDMCKDQLSDLATAMSACGITMTADGDTEDSDALSMKLCDKSSMACRDAYMAAATKYPDYNNGGTCDECRYHMDCATGAYCFNGECYQPGCTSDSECESANDGDDATCDTTLSKCYQEDEDELENNSEADTISNDELTLMCMIFVPGYEYKSSATSAAPLTLLAAVLLNGAAALLL